MASVTARQAACVQAPPCRLTASPNSSTYGVPLTAASAAGEGVDVLHAVGQPSLVPRPAAVLGAEDLAAAAHAVHLIRIARMQGQGHHGALGLDAAVEARPRLAEVVAAIEGAVLAAGGRAQTRVEHARILRRHADVAGVGERREA